MLIYVYIHFILRGDILHHWTDSFYDGFCVSISEFYDISPFYHLFTSNLTKQCTQYISAAGFRLLRLTHLSLDKMAAILADDIFHGIFLNENDRIPIQISLNYVPVSPIDNKAALVQVVAWRRTSDKPLPGPMMTQFIDAHMRH